MKSAILSALALLAGCGFHSSSHYDYGYPSPPVQTYPGQPAGVSAFIVDAGAGVVADPNTFGITTDGNVWRLTWLGDAYPRHFFGTVTCPAGCQFGYARFVNAYPGDSVTVQGDRVTFDAVTNAAVPQTLDLQAPLQPLTYDLFIDDYEATGAVVFQSQGIRSTTDVMPFALYSDNAGFKTEGKTTVAPQFISQLPKGDTSRTVMVAAPKPETGTETTAASSAAANQ